MSTPPWEAVRQITLLDPERDRIPQLDTAALRPAGAPLCAWFIVAVDRDDDFACLHGPYWDTAALAEQWASLNLVAHFSGAAVFVNVVPVEGIRAV